MMKKIIIFLFALISLFVINVNTVFAADCDPLTGSVIPKTSGFTLTVSGCLANTSYQIGVVGGGISNSFSTTSDGSGNISYSMNSLVTATYNISMHNTSGVIIVDKQINVVQGGGVYKCTWDGSKCHAVSIDCSSGGTPDETFCASQTTGGLCINTPVRACINGPADVTCNNGNGINTAIGCIPINDQTSLIGFFLKWGVGIGGGIAFLLIIFAGFQIMSSRGDPNRLKAGQELMTSAIAGLLLLIFSLVILRIIGVDILKIKGF